MGFDYNIHIGYEGVQLYDISGTISYFSGDPTLLNNVAVSLYDLDNNHIQTVYTNTYGEYMFNDVAPNTYKILISSLGNYTFDTNAIDEEDSTLMSSWIAEPFNIETVQFLAGDIADPFNTWDNSDYNILIGLLESETPDYESLPNYPFVYYFTNSIITNNPEEAITTPTIIVDGNKTEIDFYVLFTCDLNGSFNNFNYEIDNF